MKPRGTLRRLPFGTETRVARTYLQEWRRLGNDLCQALSTEKTTWRLLSFEPGFLIGPKDPTDHRTYSIGVELAERIVQLHMGFLSALSLRKLGR